MLAQAPYLDLLPERPCGAYLAWSVPAECHMQLAQHSTLLILLQLISIYEVILGAAQHSTAYGHEHQPQHSIWA